MRQPSAAGRDTAGIIRCSWGFATLFWAGARAWGGGDNFYDEYVAHVKDKKCPAGQCKDLLSYVINPEKCMGCTACARKCPVAAITGTVKQPHSIDQAKCIKCGTCIDTCKFGAISKQ